MIRIRSKSEEDTIQIGKTIGRLLEPGNIVCLDGQLGAGKTVMSKALAVALGVDEYVTSPSYTIINEYSGKSPVYHFDVYRIDDIDEMYEIGYEEYFFSEGICIIEWASMILELLPKDCLFIRIENTEDYTSRDITIEGNSKILELFKEAYPC